MMERIIKSPRLVPCILWGSSDSSVPLEDINVLDVALYALRICALVSGLETEQ